MADNTEFITYQIQVDTKSGQINIDGVTEKFEQADKAFNKLKRDIGKGLPKLNTQLDTTSKAAGGATASVMEMSRVVSDMPYGIRGVANNLTQLVSQFGFTAKAAGGASAALREMGKLMMGPLGIVFAITAVISALDYFYGAQKKAEEGTKELSEALKEQDVVLIKLVENFNKFSDNKNLSNYYTQALIKHSEKLSKILKDENKTQEEKNQALRDFKKLKEWEINNENRLIKIKRLNKELDESKKKVEDDFADRIATFKGTKYEKAVAKNLKDTLEAISKPIKQKLDKELSDYIATSAGIKDLEDTLFPKKNKEDKKKTSIIQTPEEYRTSAFDLEKEILGWDKKMLMNAVKDKDQRLQLELVFYKKSQKIRKDNQIDAEYTRNENYNDSIDKLKKEGKITEKEAQKAKDKALLVTQQKVDGIEIEYDKLIKKAEETTEALRLGLGEGGSEKRANDLARFNEYLQAYQGLMSSITSFIDGEYKRQLVIEQNKTNALNNELNERLLNENLSKEERKRIQLQIGANDEALRKKQEAIEKKAFKLNKIANIANATINTYLAASSVFANTLANPLNKLLPDGGLVRAKINAGIAVAGGLFQVAAIARQKFQSSAGSGGQIGGGFGGGSGGGNGREFNFNLAGSSDRNQIAEAIGSRFDQPLRAYVVSRDVTTQQQIDADIRSNASF